jgi:FkbM family methyltransferase
MIRQLARKVLRPALNTIGLDLVRRPRVQPLDPIQSLIKLRKIDTIIDVGANSGQFGLMVRKGGFTGLIISIEPLHSPFETLKEVASLHMPWEVYNNASGNSNGTVEINVAGNTESSSILPMCRRHEEAAPESRYIGKETVGMFTLDSQFQDRIGRMGRILLKLDVQGFESQVLSAAGHLIEGVEGLWVETSVVPMYKGSIVLEEMLLIMRQKGFLLYNVEKVLWDRNKQQLLQLDCAFFRDSPSTP